MNMSRRETMQLSATALAALSFTAIRSSNAAAQAAAAPQPDSLVDTRLRTISPLPLNPDGSAPEHMPQEAGPITGVLWKSRAHRTSNSTTAK
jgi:hypothetical protein